MNTPLIVISIIGGVVLILWAATALIFHFIFAMKKQTEAESANILKQKNIPSTDELPLEKLTVQSENGLRLSGYYVNQYPESKRVVIVVHGYRANHMMALQYAPIFIQNGYNVLVYDQRAHGKSEGRFPTYGLYESRDLHRWVQLLQERLGNDCEIGLMGHSLGGATALCYPSLNQNIRFIVADCTFATLRTFISGRLQRYHVPVKLFYPLVRRMVRRRCGFVLDAVNPIETALNEGRSIPVLFIHSKGDHIIDCCGAEEMFQKRGNPHDRLYIHKYAAHPDVYAADPDAYMRAVDEFLNNI
ncbi:alpha/beta hydrolase [Acetanaerobacterium elongatum]|uniref:AB hydrolase-1 domain-containing protein n=1 Tax=Acetanaerobacterium elongatum TaxID=258515 RepID=A0A1H0DU47_9FIRM|nr:alpha/beta hydrolase [Acetanaerobacterium elongatum]SDN73579.1 hypothetical protein SAMN05192585_13022 [Acetanaerobacterium elongatum]